MKLDKYIKKLNDQNPDDRKVLQLLNSRQYKISKKILATRIRNGLSQQQAAILVGMDLGKYLSIERAQDFASDVKIYLDVLDKLKTAVSYQIKPVKSIHSLQITKRKSLNRGYSNVNTAQIQWLHN